jgi:hypothetical protein
MRELDGLYAQEVAKGRKVILPVWHDLTLDMIQAKSPTLAGRLGISSSLGIAKLADRLIAAMTHASGQGGATGPLIHTFGRVSDIYVDIYAPEPGYFFPYYTRENLYRLQVYELPISHEDLLEVLPDATPMQSAGDTVEPSTVIGVIYMSSGKAVEAGVNGVFAKYLVREKQLVEYGEAIARVSVKGTPPLTGPKRRP